VVLLGVAVVGATGLQGTGEHGTRVREVAGTRVYLPAKVEPRYLLPLCILPPPYFSVVWKTLVRLLVIWPHVALCSFSELNFIEHYWGRAKWHMCENCDCSLKNLWELSDYALGTENCPTAHIRMIARTSWRWMDAYEKGISGPMAAFAVRKCSKHRGGSEAVEKEMNERIDRGEGREPSPLAAAGSSSSSSSSGLPRGCCGGRG
jgi:hypothetical protein